MFVVVVVVILIFDFVWIVRLLFCCFRFGKIVRAVSSAIGSKGSAEACSSPSEKNHKLLRLFCRKHAHANLTFKDLGHTASKS